MKVKAVIVDEMPENCRTECIINPHERYDYEKHERKCGVVISENHIIPDHRCLCRVEGEIK